jgi:ABC-type Fe3+-hydroxamate transport system substrate-binding protein
MVTGGRVFCDALGCVVNVPTNPQRIVSLVSGLTEMIASVGCGHRLAGVSAYCGRYVADLTAPVVGDYLTVDEAAHRAAQPDLVLLTTGVQRGLARKLHGEGYPVYVFPLPSSLHGILENLMLLGGLLGIPHTARLLRNRWLADMSAASHRGTRTPIRVYPELWFGAHARVPGALSFVTDIIECAGGINVYADQPQAYMKLDPPDVASRAPDVWLLFSEPEYPVDAEALAQQRGWNDTMPKLTLIQAGVEPHRNVIHDGPSMVSAARWLAERLAECA